MSFICTKLCPQFITKPNIAPAKAAKLILSCLAANTENNNAEKKKTSKKVVEIREIFGGLWSKCFKTLRLIVLKKPFGSKVKGELRGVTASLT